ALYRRALLLHGYRVSEANSGYAALQRIDVERPDLIVLDLILPGYDGLSVLRDIAAQPHLRDVPVIIVTGSSITVEHLQVPRVLRKPIEPAELVMSVEQCLADGRAAL
ncbi:MAG TPA: response regulator, partial [Vicinamibacterales bacterium]|nr:response regulator [Vicinamibacterales bacterium]